MHILVENGEMIKNYMDKEKTEKKRPQHVIDEERADIIRQLRKEQAQREMYDDPVMNWSGHR